MSTEYELYVDGNSGNPELIERTTSERPLSFIFGTGMMLTKFEGNLLGLEVNDTYDFIIADEDAYGTYNDEYVVELDRSLFEVNGRFDADMVCEGNRIPLMDTEGNHMNALVVSVTADKVTVDLNHPLAGKALHFKGKITEVREATDEDLQLFQGGCCSGCSGGCCCDDDSCSGCC